MPDWADGCDICTHGYSCLLDWHTAPAPLYLLVSILASKGLLRFCDCRAGNMARQYARKCWTKVTADEDRVPVAMMAAIEEWIARQT